MQKYRCFKDIERNIKVANKKEKVKIIDLSGPSKDPKVNYEINSIKSEQCFMCKNIQDQLGKDYWSFDGYLE